MNIIDLFWQYFPWSTAIIIVPAIIYYFMQPDSTEHQIENRVEVFLKGNTKTILPCTVNRDMIQFVIDETEYNEPVLTYPRITYEGGKVYRDFMFAEGLSGTVDIPDAPEEIKGLILKALKDNGLIPQEDVAIIEGDDKEKSQKKMAEYIGFYNFDIEQGDIHAVMKVFNTSINQLPYFIDELAYGIEQEGGESNFMTFAKVLVGILIGFFAGWALSLKGII